MSKFLRDEKGNLVILVIYVSVILLAVGLGIVFAVRQQVILTARDRSSNEALYVAEAGLKNAVWRVKNNLPLPNPLTGTNSNGSYRVTNVVNNLNLTTIYTLTSIGTSTDGRTKELRQELNHFDFSRCIYVENAIGRSFGGRVRFNNTRIFGSVYAGAGLVVDNGSTIDNNPPTAPGGFVMVDRTLRVADAISRVGSVIAPMTVLAENVVGANLIFNETIGNVPSLSLPKISSTQLINQANLNGAISAGDVTLDNTAFNFGPNFNYAPGNLVVGGPVFINGNFIVNRDVTYSHPSGSSQAVIYVAGRIRFQNDFMDAAGFPQNSVVAFINHQRANDAITASITLDGEANVRALLYTGGTIDVNSANLEGVIMSEDLTPSNSTITVPQNFGSNYPSLFPASNFSYFKVGKWREIR